MKIHILLLKKLFELFLKLISLQNKIESRN
jgi:hypothetical protein